MDEIINRVQNSGLVSIDLEEYIDQSERAYFDIKDGLFHGMLLKEKDFREFVKNYDWNSFKGKNVGVYCSADAIIPSWAYMLVVSRLSFEARLIAFGEADEVEKALIDEAIDKVASQNLKDSKVIIKGCGDIQNRDYAYFQISKRLIPLVSSMMYGEPCSTVPVYKKKS